jgi:hypothetical protein
MSTFDFDALSEPGDRAIYDAVLQFEIRNHYLPTAEEIAMEIDLPPGTVALADTGQIRARLAALAADEHAPIYVSDQLGSTRRYGAAETGSRIEETLR